MNDKIEHKMSASLSHTYSQDDDCCTKGPNIINVTTHDGGGGSYVVIDGKWAMDDEKDIDLFFSMIKGVLKQAQQINGEAIK